MLIDDTMSGRLTSNNPALLHTLVQTHHIGSSNRTKWRVREVRLKQCSWRLLPEALTDAWKKESILGVFPTEVAGAVFTKFYTYGIHSSHNDHEE